MCNTKSYLLLCPLLIHHLNRIVLINKIISVQFLNITLFLLSFHTTGHRKVMGGKIVHSFNLTTKGKCPSVKLAFHSHLHGKLAKVVNILATTVIPMAEARGTQAIAKISRKLSTCGNLKHVNSRN